MSIQNFHYTDYPNAMNNVPAMTKLGNGATAETFANKVVDQCREMAQLGASSATPTSVATLANATVEFRLENNIDRISTVWLRLKYANTSGASCVTSIGDGWIAHIEIYSNNGSNLLWQSNNRVEQFVTNAFLSRNEFEGMASKRFTDDNYATGVVTVLDTATGYVYIPIALPFFKAVNLRPYTIDGNLLIRITFGAAAACVQSGAMSISEATLQLSGYKESEAQQQLMLSNSSVPKCLPYWTFQHHTETLTLAASSTYQIRLFGLIGDASVVAFGIRAVANVSSPS